MRRIITNRFVQLFIIALLSLAIPMSTPSASAQVPTRPDIQVISRLSADEFAAMKASLTGPDDYCFAETGNCIVGRFAEYFWDMGGVPVFGFPISGEFKEVSVTNGQTYTVQYFQRNLFEFHPENAPPSDVLSALLGLEEYKARYFFMDLTPFLEIYYSKCTTSPHDLSPFIGALNHEWESRTDQKGGSHVGTAIPANGGGVPGGSVFWTNTDGKAISGAFTPVCKSGSLVVGYAHSDVHIPTGGRTIRIFGFFDPRMLVENCPCIR